MNAPPDVHDQVRLLAVCLLLITSLLTACTPPTTASRGEAQVEAFAARGYASSAHASYATTRYTWTLRGQPVTLVLAQPTRAGPTPLVIYLPGLGEPSDAGERWRQAWAAAGYAVLSVQLLDEDAQAWQSPLARAGAFKALGHQRYAGALVQQRAQALLDLVAEIQHRASAGEAPWQRLDWGRLALAGYDLGAYTAMTLAGEHVPDADAMDRRLPLRAIVVLSPHASAAQGAFDTRYRDIRTPVMSLTSDRDNDALGVMEDVALRQAPFTHMLAPDKYLLALHGLPHARFSGNTPTTAPRAEGASRKPPTGEPPGGAGASGSHGHGRHSRPEGGIGSGHDLSDDEASGLSPAELQMGVIAAEDVSTAFLDAYLMNDALARTWLQTDVPPWLGHAGELRRK